MTYYVTIVNTSNYDEEDLLVNGGGKEERLRPGEQVTLGLTKGESHELEIEPVDSVTSVQPRPFMRPGLTNRGRARSDIQLLPSVEVTWR